MRKTINGETIEGTPEEILAYERAAGTLSPYVPVESPVVDTVSNAARLRDFRAKVALTPAVADKYLQQLRVLEAHIAPRPILSASTTDIATIRDELLAKCANLQTMSARTHTPGLHSCKKGLFVRALDALAGSTVATVTMAGEKPPFCTASCASYAFSPYPASVFLIAVKRFFDHYDDIVPRNPAKKLLTDFFGEYDLNEYLNERYCPSPIVVTHLLQRARDPRACAVILLLAKTGRRSDVIARLCWTDIDLDKGMIDLSRVRAERVQLSGRGRTKLRALGFKTAFIDAETAETLRDYRQNYWLPTVAKDPAGAPMTDAIWLDQSRGGVAKRGTLQGWLDGAIKDAGLWDEHGAEGLERLTPHCFRHFFTTILQSGAQPAPRDFVKLLRGDVLGDAMQRYEHVPLADLRNTYLRHMPRLAS